MTPDTSRPIDPAAQEDALRDELDAVHRDPRRSIEVARRVLSDSERSQRVEMHARWLMGRAQNEVGEVRAACETLAIARSMALRAGDAELAAQIAVSEAACLMADGHTSDAYRRLEDARPHLSGGPLGRLVMQRGLLELHRGGLRLALADLDAAEPLLDAAGDHAALARLFANRGAGHAQGGDFGHARTDLERCRRLASRSGLDLVCAGAAHNLGFLEGQLGNIPVSLGWYETARNEYDQIGLPRRLRAVLDLDLCTTMSMAGLTTEAIAAGRRAVESADLAGDRITLGDALLQLALAQAAADHIDAASTARRAMDVLSADGRAPLAALAEYVSVKARVASSTLTDDSVDIAGMTGLIDVLDRHGWTSEADDVRLFVAEHARDRVVAGDLLERVAAARRDQRWHRRVSGWYAEGLARRRDDPRGAERALRAGLRIADDHRASLAATDLRASLSGHTTQLARLGLELALESGDTDSVVYWAERAHAPSIAMRPVRPPRDARLAALLADLRRAQTGDDQDEIARLESEIGAVARTARSTGAVRGPRAQRRLADAFVDVDLVEYVTAGDQLIAVVVTDRQTEVHRLGAAAAVDEPATYAMSAIRRLSHPTISELSAATSTASLHDAAAQLDAILVEPLALRNGRPLVVVPDDSQQGVPWAALPGLAERPFAIAPSASSWALRRDDRPTAAPVVGLLDDPVVALIAGPELDGADGEVEALAEVWVGQAVVSTAAESTVERSLRRLDGCDIAHLAAHGTFRSDSPSFSSIHVADGHLTVYDLEGIDDPPRIVVLAACDLALMAVRGAGDLLGTAAALLHLGVGSVVASVATLGDSASKPVMVALHEHLRDGVDPATALMYIRSDFAGLDSDPSIAAAIASLIVISDDHTVPRRQPEPPAAH